MKYILGADEVGRGSLAGPVYVGGVMVPESMERLPGITDSKKLTGAKRWDACDRIKAAEEVHWATASRSAAYIDQVGINPALVECFNEVIDTLLVSGDDVDIRVDGEPIVLKHPAQFIVKGDLKDWRIGAASIVAKVTRDELMRKWAKTFPGYDWDRNMGYGTQAHIAAIKRLGVTPEHRQKFCRKFTAVEDEGIFDLFG